jgi:Transglutaminase-like superfamily
VGTRSEMSRRLQAASARGARWARRARSVSAGEWAVFVTAAALNPVVLVLLRLKGTRATSQLVERVSARRLASRRRALTPETIVAAKRIAALVNRGAAWPMPAVTCLARSLTAQIVLQRRGIESQLCIGVRPAATGDVGASGGLLFHAWVEVGGVVVNDVLDIGDQFLAFPLEQGLDAIVTAGR